MSLRAQKKLQTQNEILRVAKRLLARRGYEATTMRDIAAAAQLSYQTLYNYFPTKVLVINGVLQQAMTAHVASLRETVEAYQGDVLASLSAMVSHRTQLVMAHDRILWREMTIDSIRRLNSEAAIEFTDATPDLIEQLLLRAQQQGQLQPGLNCRQLSHALYAIIEFCLLEFIMSDSQEVTAITAQIEHLIAPVVVPYLC